jgi:hypothetical protein
MSVPCRHGEQNIPTTQVESGGVTDGRQPSGSGVADSVPRRTGLRQNCAEQTGGTPAALRLPSRYRQTLDPAEGASRDAIQRRPGLSIWAALTLKGCRISVIGHFETRSSFLSATTNPRPRPASVSHRASGGKRKNMRASFGEMEDEIVRSIQDRWPRRTGRFCST